MTLLDWIKSLFSKTNFKEESAVHSSKRQEILEVKAKFLSLVQQLETEMKQYSLLRKELWIKQRDFLYSGYPINFEEQNMEQDLILQKILCEQLRKWIINQSLNKLKLNKSERSEPKFRINIESKLTNLTEEKLVVYYNHLRLKGAKIFPKENRLSHGEVWNIRPVLLIQDFMSFILPVNNLSEEIKPLRILDNKIRKHAEELFRLIQKIK